MKRFRGVIALFFVLALVAAACSSSSDDTTTTAASGGEETTTTAASGGEETTTTAASGGEETTTTAAPAMAEDVGIVEIFGPETATELVAFQDAMVPWEEESAKSVLITGDRSFQELNDVRIEGGNPPDIGIYAQPGKIKDLASRGVIQPLPDELVAELSEMYDPFWLELGSYEGNVYGVPNKADLKSLVWYSPEAFDAAGYTIPTTWDELVALQDTMKANGQTPWCIGIGSGSATGWPYTDWMEDIMLRLHGPEVYDQWVNHEIPFDDPKVIEVGNFINDLWGEEGNVFGGRETIASTDFGDSGLPLLDGKCMMHRQANFYANFWVDPGRSGSNPDAVLGPNGQVNVFYLPTISDEFGTVVLGAGTHAVMFNNRAEVVDALRYIGSPTYGELRSQLAPPAGFLNPNTAQDLDVAFGDDEFSKGLGAILLAADPFRFDASDLMPGDIGAGEFWSAATDITAGNTTVEEGFAKVEEVWQNLG